MSAPTYRSSDGQRTFQIQLHTRPYWSNTTVTCSCAKQHTTALSMATYTETGPGSTEHGKEGRVVTHRSDEDDETTILALAGPECLDVAWEHSVQDLDYDPATQRCVLEHLRSVLDSVGKEDGSDFHILVKT